MGKPGSHPGLSDPNTQDPNHHSTWAGVKRRKNVSHMSSPHCLFPQTRICPSFGVNFSPFLPSPRSLTDPAYALDPSLFLPTSVPHVRPRAALADEKLWAESFFGLLHRKTKYPAEWGPGPPDSVSRDDDYLSNYRTVSLEGISEVFF